jgi:hypothetical protein
MALQRTQSATAGRNTTTLHAGHHRAVLSAFAIARRN